MRYNERSFGTVNLTPAERIRPGGVINLSNGSAEGIVTHNHAGQGESLGRSYFAGRLV